MLVLPLFRCMGDDVIELQSISKAFKYIVVFR